RSPPALLPRFRSAFCKSRALVPAVWHIYGIFRSICFWYAHPCRSLGRCPRDALAEVCTFQFSRRHTLGHGSRQFGLCIWGPLGRPHPDIEESRSRHRSRGGYGDDFPVVAQPAKPAAELRPIVPHYL